MHRRHAMLTVLGLLLWASVAVLGCRGPVPKSAEDASEPPAGVAQVEKAAQKEGPVPQVSVTSVADSEPAVGAAAPSPAAAGADVARAGDGKAGDGKAGDGKVKEGDAGKKVRPKSGKKAQILSIHLHPEVAKAEPGQPQGASMGSLLAKAGDLLLPKEEGQAVLAVLPLMAHMGLLNPPMEERMKAVLQAQYGDLAEWPGFDVLESTMQGSAQSLVDATRPVRPDHFFLLLPDDYSKERTYRVMLFIHGMSMNFQAYAWSFFKEALHNDWILVFPTIEGWHGRGMEWPEFYGEIYAWLSQNYSVTAGGMAVVGHSAGAFDALRFAALHPQLVCGVVASAGHWDAAEAVKLAPLWPALGKRPVLVQCAEEDEIVPLAACREVHRGLSANGVSCKFEVGENMDHFTMMEAGSGLQKRLLEWSGEACQP